MALDRPASVLLREAVGPSVVRFSPRGHILAAGTRGGTLHGWALEGALSRALGSATVGDAVEDILFSPLLSLLVTRGPRHLRGWRIPDLGQSFEMEVGEMAGAAFLPDGYHMAVTVEGHVLRIDLRERVEVSRTARLSSRLTQVALETEGTTLFALCLGDAARPSLIHLDAATLAVTQHTTLPSGSHHFALARRGERVAVSNGQVSVVPFPDGSPRMVLPPFAASALDGNEATPAAYPLSWTPPLFTSDGRLLAAAASDGRVCLWDLARGSLVRELKGHTEGVTSLDLMHGHARLASCADDGTVRLWDLRQVRRP